jgi:hypothetical protein
MVTAPSKIIKIIMEGPNDDPLDIDVNDLSEHYRIERWVFTEWELHHPLLCNASDEFWAPVMDAEDWAVVYRNGEMTNRWSDGTVGVPTDLIIDDEGYYKPKHRRSVSTEMRQDGYDIEADQWYDVYVGDQSEFVAFVKPLRFLSPLKNLTDRDF